MPHHKHVAPRRGTRKRKQTVHFEFKEKVRIIRINTSAGVVRIRSNPNRVSSYSWNGKVCDLSTSGLTAKSKKEVWNYAYLVNQWLLHRRGKQVKIKKVKANQRYLAGQFQSDIRKGNTSIFPVGQTGTQAMVVGHVPDTAISGDPYPCHRTDAAANLGGPTPGWMAMTAKANNRVSKIAGTGGYGKWLQQITVNGVVPTGLTV